MQFNTFTELILYLLTNLVGKKTVLRYYPWKIKSQPSTKQKESWALVEVQKTKKGVHTQINYIAPFAKICNSPIGCSLDTKECTLGLWCCLFVLGYTDS